MLVYEVNLTVDQDITEAYSQWLKVHIQDITALDGFTGAQLSERDPQDDSENGKGLWTVYYFLESRAVLDDYFKNHAPAFREDGIKKFGDKFQASRRILKPLDRF